MLDYVFSDDRQAIWDNNGGKDYHTLVAEPASGGWGGRGCVCVFVVVVVVGW